MTTLNLKGISCLVLLCFIFISSHSQNSNVSIGTEALKDRAILWLKANGNQGLLLPVVNNRGTFSGLNNGDDKGMLIFDNSDNKVYFWNGSAWIEAGGGGSGSNQTLTLNGNSFTLSGSPASSFNLSSNTPQSGQALVWNGTSWTAVSVTGDVTGTISSSEVSGIKGKPVPTLPATTNALVYDGAAWTFQPISSAGEANTASNVGTAGVGVFRQKTGSNLEFQKINAASNRVTVTQDAINNEIDIDVSQINLSLASTQITGLGALATLSTITSAQITDGTITNVDISPTANVAVTKLAPGTDGQVLSVSGGIPVWATPSGSGTVTNIATGTGLTGGPITGSGTISVAPAGVTATELADNSVNSNKIVNGSVTGVDIAATTITADKLAQSSAAPGQVLKWNGTNWVAQNDDTGAGAVPTLNAGQILIGDGTANAAAALSGDATLAGGVITISNNAITTAKINAAAVDNAKLADNAVTSAKITDGTIVNVDVNAGAAIAGTKINPDFGAQNILTTGFASLGQLNVSSTTLKDGGIISITSPGAGANQGMRINVGGSTTTNYGVYPYVGGGTTSYGVHAYSESSTGTGYGVYGRAFGSTPTAYGVYGEAAAGATNWAGYFAGNTAVTGGLAVGGSNNYGTVGQVLTSAGPGVAPSWADNAASGWGLTGNAGTDPATNFIGTTDAQRLVFRTSNNERATILANGNVGINTTTPRSVLELRGGNLILSGDDVAPLDPVDIDFKTRDDVFKAKIWVSPSANTLWMSTSTDPVNNRQFTLLQNGNVGIGTTSPDVKLNVQHDDSNGGISITRANATISKSELRFKRQTVTKWTLANDFNETGAQTFTIYDNEATESRLFIDQAGRIGISRTPSANTLEVEGSASKTTATAWLANSDRRIKTDIKDIENSFELIKKLRPVKFRYSAEWKALHPSIEDHDYYNFIAQEYQEVFPASVKESGEYLEGDNKSILQIDTYNAQIAAIKAVQELIAKVEILEIENQKLKSENTSLESKLTTYEENQESIRKELAEIKAMLGVPTSQNTKTDK